MKTDRELRIKSAEVVFDAIIEHTKDLIDKNIYLDYYSLNESRYGFIITSCIYEIMRKLDIPISCDEVSDIIEEYIQDIVCGYDCNFEDMCIALIEGR